MFPWFPEAPLVSFEMMGTHLRASHSHPPAPLCTLKVGGGLTGVATIRADLELRVPRTWDWPGLRLGKSLANSLPSEPCPPEDVGTKEQSRPCTMPATYK